MELTEGLTFVKPPKRAATFGAKPTLVQLQRRLPQSNGEGLNPPSAQTKQWAVDIWQRFVFLLVFPASIDHDQAPVPNNRIER